MYVRINDRSVARGNRLSSSNNANKPNGRLNSMSNTGRLSLNSTKFTGMPSDIYSCKNGNRVDFAFIVTYTNTSYSINTTMRPFISVIIIKYHNYSYNYNYKCACIECLDLGTIFYQSELIDAQRYFFYTQIKYHIYLLVAPM